MGKGKKILITLGAVWVVIIIYNLGLFGSAEERRANSSPSINSKEIIRKLKLLDDFKEINIDLLERKRPRYKGVIKDIFSPLNLAGSSRKPRVSKPRTVRSVPPARSSKGVPQPPVLPQSVKRLNVMHEVKSAVFSSSPTPLKNFSAQVKLIGFLEKGDQRTIFISKGQDVFLLKENDILDGMFIVKEINGTAVTFQDIKSAEKISMNVTD